MKLRFFSFGLALCLWLWLSRSRCGCASYGSSSAHGGGLAHALSFRFLGRCLGSCAVKIINRCAIADLALIIALEQLHDSHSHFINANTDIGPDQACRVPNIYQVFGNHAQEAPKTKSSGNKCDKRHDNACNGNIKVL